MAVMIPLCATILPFSVILHRRIKPEGTGNPTILKLYLILSCVGLERKRASHLALRLQRHTTIAHDTWPKACGFRRGDMPCSPTKLRKARPGPRHRRYAAALAHPSCTGGVLAVPRRLTAASRPSARGRCGWRCLLRRPRACRPRWRSRRRRRRPRTPSRRRHSAGRARRS